MLVRDREPEEGLQEIHTRRIRRLRAGAVPGEGSERVGRWLSSGVGESLAEPELWKHLGQE